MAHNGSSGPGPGPGSRQAPGSALRVSPSDTTISLSQPRPDVDRSRNEYIDTPLKGGLRHGPSQASGASLHASDHLALVQPPRDKKSSSSLKRQHSERPITKQPGSKAEEEEGVTRAAPPSTTTTTPDCSIICPDCGKCRCEACRTPKPLPEKWLCRDKCLCSAGALVDYLSCLCCVKAMLYHCASEEEESSFADRPCSCSTQQHCLARWACLAPLSLLLPCLWCYWPLKACVKLVEKCHQQCHRHGCQCPATAPSHPFKPHDQVITVSPTQSKKLLEHP